MELHALSRVLEEGSVLTSTWRSVDEVVSELSQTGVTLFGDPAQRQALRAALRIHDNDAKDAAGSADEEGSGHEGGS